jgi:hypothetical protein
MSKIARLLALSALLALPTSNPAQAAGCVPTCVSALGCGEGDDTCAAYAREMCICQCLGYDYRP